MVVMKTNMTKRLKQALDTIKDECNKHTKCVECPISKCNGKICAVGNEYPCNWKVPDSEEVLGLESYD